MSLSHAYPPSGKQLQYIADLAQRAGMDYEVPESQAEAHLLIQELKKLLPEGKEPREPRFWRKGEKPKGENREEGAAVQEKLDEGSPPTPSKNDRFAALRTRVDQRTGA
jgi:hypothetical protein